MLVPVTIHLTVAKPCLKLYNSSNFMIRFKSLVISRMKISKKPSNRNLKTLHPIKQFKFCFYIIIKPRSNPIQHHLRAPPILIASSSLSPQILLFFHHIFYFIFHSRLNENARKKHRKMKMLFSPDASSNIYIYSRSLRRRETS